MRYHDRKYERATSMMCLMPLVACASPEEITIVLLVVRALGQDHDRPDPPEVRITDQEMNKAQTLFH